MLGFRSSLNTSISQYSPISQLKDSFQKKSFLWTALNKVTSEKSELDECGRAIREVLNGLTNYEPIATKSK